MVEAAAANGKMIACEKPLATNAEDGQRMVEAVSRTWCGSTIGECRR